MVIATKSDSSHSISVEPKCYYCEAGKMLDTSGHVIIVCTYVAQTILILDLCWSLLEFLVCYYLAGEGVGDSVSLVTRNFEQLSVKKDDTGFPSEGNTPSVVIPDHLQVQAADCSHLSFGSFGSSMTASNSSGSVPVKSNLEEGHSQADISSAGHMDTRYRYK